MKSKEELLQQISDCVFEMEDEEVLEVIKEYLACGYDAKDAMLEGLVDGMMRASDMYDEGEYYIPELLICSDAMYNGINELKQYLPEESAQSAGKVIIGVVEGDTHDIGKNLVRIMMETGGFEVVDLGRDVPVQTFINYVKEHEVDIVAMSTLMTTCMPCMKQVIDGLKAEGLRDKVKVMVGGAPLSKKFCDEIGADVYTKNATEAVAEAKKLMGIA